METKKNTKRHKSNGVISENVKNINTSIKKTLSHGCGLNSSTSWPEDLPRRVIIKSFSTYVTMTSQLIRFSLTYDKCVNFRFLTFKTDL